MGEHFSMSGALLFFEGLLTAATVFFSTELSAEKLRPVLPGVISISSINFKEFFDILLLATFSRLTLVCALAVDGFTKKTPMATATKNKFFIRKL